MLSKQILLNNNFQEVQPFVFKHEGYDDLEVYLRDDCCEINWCFNDRGHKVIKNATKRNWIMLCTLYIIQNKFKSFYRCQ
jgi:hypothetical protein